MITETIQELDPGALVELFELDTTVIGGESVWYFHAGTNDVSVPIVFQGKTYQNFPIVAAGFDMSAKGTLARPSLTVSNATGMVTIGILELEDMVGAKVTRHRTFARYLDGQPTADPLAELPVDVFYIEQKKSENKVQVEFELASALDFDGVRLPMRTITTNVCMWEYRSAECSYTDEVYFDVNDVSVDTPDLDVCGKRVSSCKCRFGSNQTPFGGFPASRTYKS